MGKLIDGTFVSIQALLQNVLFDGTILYQLNHYGKVDWWYLCINAGSIAKCCI
jgi:hypothetical protein